MTPIKPENRDRYPDNWSTISESIRMRDGFRCVECGVGNGAVGWRMSSGTFVTEGGRSRIGLEDGLELDKARAAGIKPIRIVLTVHHIDATPENNDPANLVSLCQRCHLAKHRKTKAPAPSLFDEGEGE